MILGFDIGNTHIVAGIFDPEGQILLKFRVASSEKLTEDELFSYLKNISDFHKVKVENIEGIVISSVVPNLTTIFVYLSRKYFNMEPVIVSSKLDLPIVLDVENPGEVGADRICNIVEAVNLYGDRDMVVIDLGTATTFEVISSKKYIGGAILPGVNLQIKALFQNTAKLPNVRFVNPQGVLGRNTIEQINAGIFYGSVGQIKELLNEIKKEISDPYIIATGGIGGDISQEIDDIDEFIPDLTMHGLYTIYKENK